MSLDSPLFLFAFLPVCMLLHRPLYRRSTLRRAVIVLAGLLFCAFGSIPGTVVLIAWSMLTFLFGKVLQRNRKLLSLGVAANLGLLFFYKYLAFFAGEILHIPGVVSFASTLAVPIGISFFTFKCISYLAKVSTCPAQSPAELLAYLTFFPTMVAGPILSFPAFRDHWRTEPDLAACTEPGLRLFFFGFAKKMLLAYPMARIADGAFGATGVSVSLAWIGAAAYMLQIYFDFSAYSDMANGLSCYFGMGVTRNFNYPYMASTIKEFWNRWHISLSRWFRDQVYIPLGGNRKGEARTALNKFIVFTLCGFWHGASWTFLCWGIWHGILSALESFQIIPTEKLNRSLPGRVVSHLYTLLAVLFGFVLFRAGSLSQAVSYFGAMFGIGTVSSQALLHSLLGWREIVAFGLCTLFCFPIARDRLENRTATFLSLGLFLVSLCVMAAAGFQPFIYAQF